MRIYPMFIPIVPHVNRSNRRQIEFEGKMIAQKLDALCSKFEIQLQELNKIDLYQPLYSEKYSDLFNHWDALFQSLCDKLTTKIKFHSLHRGYFHMMYAPETIGKERNEDVGKINSLKNISRMPIEQNIAKILS